ncbi:hypothetical protein [Sporosarcina sp. 6E9]|uniref:hypothetical protein n=1 Tax=Sporosarcina sp. 6E9 TaxID=2819235 RepID=UPI001B30BDEA|nr:hypothetical protein [Sporosarcina sp. 6E9]
MKYSPHIGIAIMIVFFTIALVIALVERQAFFITMHTLGLVGGLLSLAYNYKKYRKD